MLCQNKLKQFVKEVLDGLTHLFTFNGSSYILYKRFAVEVGVPLNVCVGKKCMLHYQNYTQIAVYNVICGFVTHPSEKIHLKPPIAFPIELHCSNLKYFYKLN